MICKYQCLGKSQGTGYYSTDIDGFCLPVVVYLSAFLSLVLSLCLSASGCQSLTLPPSLPQYRSILPDLYSSFLAHGKYFI